MTRIPSLTRSQTGADEPTNVDIYVLGGGVVGKAVTQRLQADGHAVALIDRSQTPAESHVTPDITVHRADPTDVGAMTEAGVEGASTVIVATRSDSQNLLIAQLAKVQFDVERVLVLTNDPDRIEAIADAGHDPVCATTVLSRALAEHV